jgi:hypothetical protein
MIRLSKSSFCALVAAVAMLTGLPLLAPAQQVAPETAPQVQAAPQSSYLASVKPVYDMVILGDLLGTGVWAGMNRVVESDDRVTVTGRIQESAGLARPRFYNWADAATKLLEARSFDIAVIVLGANDARDMSSDAGVAEFGSQEWKDAYSAQIKALVGALRANKVAIYWFGVPPMERESYDAAMKVIAEVERQVMAELGVRYIDLELMLRAPDGSYTDTGDDGTGEQVRLRSRDGIKFITRGNDRLAFELMKLVGADIAVAEGSANPADVPAIASGDVELTPDQLAALPAFAAERADGAEPEIVDRKLLPGPGFVELATLGDVQKNKPGDALFAATVQATEPGSAARKLYEQGIWPGADGPAANDPFIAPIAASPAN